MNEKIGKYTMSDIANFLIDYRWTEGSKPKSWVVGVPLVGKKIYEKSRLEHYKVVFFEQAYNNALNGSNEDKMKFIIQMALILDDFYGIKKQEK